jgi:3-oxoacyl-[acyl-carrier-protein] synthase II
MGLLAGQDALQDAGILANEEVRRWDVGVVAGTALAGWTQVEQQIATLLERGASRINPFLVNSSGRHATATELAALIGVTGPTSTISSGCVSAAQAIADAHRLVRTKEAVACLAGGTESPLSPLIFAALSRTNELSTEDSQINDVSRPFDRRHNGFVLSEGASFVVLEDTKAARRRGARVYAEVLGGTSSCDAGGMYHLDSSGEAGARALLRLMNRADVKPDEIDYVCAHANSGPAFDRKEATVLKKALGEFAARIPVSSIKGVLGHPFGASGAFQTAAVAFAMRDSLIPPTANLQDPDPECELDLVMGEPRKQTIRHALVTSYGYGGVNAYLLLRNPNL